MSGRLEYIDAMRGLAMVLVVISHVYVRCFTSPNVYSTILCDQIQIPLFFFISGFFADRMLHKKMAVLLWCKLKRLIIPTLIMLGLYCAVFEIDFASALFKNMKEGYWFTISLFEYSLLYVLISYALIKIRLNDSKRYLSHLFIGILVSYVGSYARTHGDDCSLIPLFTIPELFNYVFFIIGAIFFRYGANLCNRLKHCNLLWGGVIASYILVELLFFRYGIEWLSVFATLTYLLIGLLALIIIWYLFVNNVGNNLNNCRVRFLSLVGRRSLDVYFIHYFFLPGGFGVINSYFDEINAPFIEFLLVFTIALCLIIASIGVGIIIRQSSFAASLLLGDGSYITN